MNLSTRLAISCLIMLASFAVWIGGIRVQWWMALRDVRQSLVMILVLALPAYVAPLFARAALSPILPDSALLSMRAAIWFGAVLLLVLAGVAGLLTLGIDETLVAKLAIVCLFLGAFISTYAGRNSATPRGTVERLPAQPQNNEMRLTNDR